MNRITIGRKVYDLGQVTHQKFSAPEFEKVREYFKRDKPHVVNIDDKAMVRVEQAMFDPKLKIYDLYYRPLTLVFIKPKERDEEIIREQDVLFIRSIRGPQVEL